MAPTPSLSVVIVTYESRDDVARSLPPLLEQLTPADELIVVDNASSDGTADAVAELAPAAKLIGNEANEGFAAGCNRGAAAAGGDVLLLLNPDTEVRPGFRDAIVAPLAERRWAAWMGLITRDGGARVNSAGNVVHFAGFTWAGGDGLPASEAPRTPRPVPSLSGACLAVPRAEWDRLGGFAEQFFTYLEDTDLSLRLRLAGGELGIEPAAAVEHRYEFSKPGSAKWRHLERNRWAMLIRTYPAALLALIFPALLLTELALVAVSIAGGWFPAKLRANLDLIRLLPRLLGERRAIRAQRTVPRRRVRRGAERRARLGVPRPGGADPPAALGAADLLVGGAGAARRRLARRVGPRVAGAGRGPGARAQFLIEPRGLLGEHLVLLGQARDRHREVEQQQEHEAEGDPEQRVGRCRDPEQVGDLVEQVRPGREQQHDHAGGEPEQRVALAEPPLADKLEHEQQHAAAGDDRDDLELGAQLRSPRAGREAAARRAPGPGGGGRAR